MTDEKEKIEQTKVLFPKTKAGNKMLKAIIKRAKQQGKSEAIKQVMEIMDKKINELSTLYQKYIKIDPYNRNLNERKSLFVLINELSTLRFIKQRFGELAK